MKTSKQFLLWFAVVVMFCAVISIGCGGSSNSSSSTQPEETTGRNDGWEDLTFGEFAGAWEISSITMGMGSGIQLYPPELGITRFKFTPAIQGTGGSLAITTLDGREAEYLRLNFSDDLGHTANNVVVLSGGRYAATNLDNVYRQNTNDGQTKSRYLLQGFDAEMNTSFPWKYVYFENTYEDQTNVNNNYFVRTVLQKIPDDTVEDLSLIAGDWKIVSASLQVRGSNLKYVLFDWESDYDPDIRLIPVSNRLFWSRNTGSNASYNSYPFNLEFMDNFMNSTIVDLIDPEAGAYTMLAPNLLETARTDSSGNAIDFHRIEGSGVVP